MATGRQQSGQSRSDATRRGMAAKTLLWGVEIILPISGSDKEAPPHRYYSGSPEGDGEHVEA